MRRRLLVVALVALITGAAPARAHIGAAVAKAAFCSPSGPTQTMTDGGFEYRYDGAFVPDEADAHYVFSWVDGDQDPTGRFTFYWFDHRPPPALAPSLIDGKNEDGSSTGVPGIGKVLRTVDGREARDVYVSCSCERVDAGQAACDGGVMPVCSDGGARWCDNTIDWDTSALPDGVYWIVAVNLDPPYHVWNSTEAPVRVVHAGGKRYPVVLVTHPDGIGGSADKSFRVEAIVAGTPPFTFDFAYGVNLATNATDPVQVITRGVSLAPTSDGRVSWDWDVSAVPSHPYYVEVTVTDATGTSTYSDSKDSVSVFHRASPPDLGHADGFVAADLSASVSGDLGGPAPSGNGCGCTVGSRSRPSDGKGALWLALLGLGLVSLRGRWRGSRIACTG